MTLLIVATKCRHYIIALTLSMSDESSRLDCGGDQDDSLNLDRGEPDLRM